MNVIFVTSSYYPELGGLQVVLWNLANTLKGLGHNVHVVTTANNWHQPELEVIDEVPVHYFPMWMRGRTLRANVLYGVGIAVSIFRLKKLVKRLSPCVVHVHFIFSNAVCINLMKFWLKARKIPVVVTFHGGDEAPLLTEKYQKENPHQSRLLTRTALGLLNKADAITAVSGELKTLIEKVWHKEGQEIRVINNSVDADFFVPGQAKGPDVKLIFAAGRLTYQKGFDVLLGAFSKISKKFNNLRLCIVGDGILRQSLEDQARGLGIGGSVDFMGPFSREEFLGALQGADIVAITSRYEGCSLMLLEAMACGKPLVTTEVGLVRDVIVDGANGMLVPIEDVPALVRALTLLIENHELRNRLGLAARESIVSSFSWGTISRQYVDLYQSVLK